MAAGDAGGYWFGPSVQHDSGRNAKLMSTAVGDDSGRAGVSGETCRQKGDGKSARAYPSLLCPMMAASLLFCVLFSSIALGQVMVSSQFMLTLESGLRQRDSSGCPAALNS